MKLFSTLGRSWAYFKQGWGGYISFVLGLVVYLTIIYNFLLTQYFPHSPIDYVIILFAIILTSIAVGYLAKRSGLWGNENLLATEANPVINIPIGKKEILNYTLHLQGLDMSIANTEVTIEMLNTLIKDPKKLKVATGKLYRNLKILKEQKRQINDMLKSAKH
jgi:hypothetical protein